MKLENKLSIEYFTQKVTVKPVITPIRMGIDIGSTTVKVVVLDDNDGILFSRYERHRADIRSTIIAVVGEVLVGIKKMLPAGSEQPLSIKVTGSGGIAVSYWLSIPFVQEVVASTTAVKKLIPQTDIMIELGGEDAKITYFKGGMEQRMNGTCAGGTGAFIDQMAALLETDASGLNELARKAETIYPIASRCGVFAKTDIQPLINEGAHREDIAASIFQAVVNQTISGLACGKPIRGNIAFLGGPLHFLDQLRHRFIVTLKLAGNAIIVPEESHLFVATGAALSAEKTLSSTNLQERTHFPTVTQLHEALKGLIGAEMREIQRLEPLFNNEEELEEFHQRHAREVAATGDLSSATGPLFLGLDSGSTTTKAILIDHKGNILWQFYDVNAGNPVELAVRVLKDLYNQLPSSVYIARSISTGYGEALFQAALSVDSGEIETIAHYRAADFFMPGVEFLLDIGGQDMKCLNIKEGAITSIQLNEACSSGCGSFLGNFAQSLGMNVQEFSKIALLAENPVDLGSRCTVFMNSRVKQAQKEGATVADISAGLSYSVIKNALFKVIKLRKPDSIGTKIVVQGGTFNNNAVLRAFEKIAGIDVFRPDIAGLMGAYGAALIALDQWTDLTAVPAKASPEEREKLTRRIESGEFRSGIADLKQLEAFKVDLNLQRCKKCSNNCLLTINTFTMNKYESTFFTGNRCERGVVLAQINKARDSSGQKPACHIVDASNAYHPDTENSEQEEHLPNLYAWKYNRLFSYKPLASAEAKRGDVGLLRVLNMYENYPLWFTFFTQLGFRVRLSPRSTRTIYEKGLETIPSESVCYPGKIAHGHVPALLETGVKFIFYPCIPYEQQEDPEAENHYNCPIVTSYPEVLRNNIDELRHDPSIDFMHPFLPIYDKKRLAERLFEELNLKFPDLTLTEIQQAVESGWTEQNNFKKELQQQGEKALKTLTQRGASGILLAGQPYHLDPEINHGLPELITGLGLGVLTEDSVAHLGQIERPLRIMDQWTYHNRLYRASTFAAKMPNLEVVQLTSFGCGLNAVTADQIEEILNAHSRMYTLIKIDEGSNLGAVRIRIRSLIAAMKERSRRNQQKVITSATYQRQTFTKKMKKSHTILVPQLSPIHFRLVQIAFEHSGYNLIVLPEVDAAAVETGLKYVNNDACYPSILIAGQLIAALQSGKYDLNHVSLLMAQTGGGCRATNYIGFIRRALIDADLAQIPVISLSAQEFETNPGFKVTPALLVRGLRGLMLGDLLMRLLHRTRPYETTPGAANALYEKWNSRAQQVLKSLPPLKYNRLIKNIVDDFDKLPLLPIKKPRIGLVGEILVKFHPTANNNIINIIEQEGAECIVLDFIDFFFYTLSTGIFRHKELAFPKKSERTARLLIWILESFRRTIKKELTKSNRFEPPVSIYDLMKGVNDIVQLGNITGEGWFLTAEMVELIESGVPSIVCVQPFACLPNHVTGKGMIKELKERYPKANIAAIDYDPGASEVNQLNRLKLLLANAPLE